MQNPIDAITATLFDAADAPHLREENLALKATVTRLTAENMQQARQIERLKLDVKFYYESFTGKQLKAVDEIFGLTGGG